MYKYINTFVLLIFLFSGCRQQIDRSGFDAETWKRDPLACQGDRLQLVPGLEKLRPRLYGHNYQQIIPLLGRPDAEEIREGAQRVFLYYLEPGPQCEQIKNLAEGTKVLIRFNAMGLVSEVSYSQPIGDLLSN
jgi:hypothetical protein